MIVNTHEKVFNALAQPESVVTLSVVPKCTFMSKEFAMYLVVLKIAT